MSERIVIVGGGVGGTLLANVVSKELAADQAQVTVIDEFGQHLYQPGWLYVPFGEETPGKLRKRERSLLRKNVELIVERVVGIDPVKKTVQLAGKTEIPYDILVLATGSRVAPEEVPGFAEGAHHFYTSDAAIKLRARLDGFEGGRLVVGVADIPYKCPPAPLEFVFKVDEFLSNRGLRDKTELVYLSPINRAFTIESVSEFVTPMLEERNIRTEVFFNTEEIDPVAKKVTSLEGDEIDYDLLVMVPPHRGSKVIIDTGLGDRMGWLPTDRFTLAVANQEDIYGLGDATDIPVSKSGSAAHFEAKVLADRIVHRITGKETGDMLYDGRVLCFLETGYGQATQLAFDFENPPQPPKPSRYYHYQKTLFNKVYWYIVPRGLV
ncbi:MAG: NAD(P)/FAD-dependent oxidoreductase [Thermomicrobiales bacterium]|nr:NAD(P)/FAD-dependent oxidoreductase [Thermomicrobiales bacterium]